MTEPTTYYTTRQMMAMLGIKSRQTIHNRLWTDRAERVWPDDPSSPLMWSAEVVAELAAEYGVEL